MFAFSTCGFEMEKRTVAPFMGIDQIKFGDQSFKLKSYMDALHSRDGRLFAEAEQSTDPILNGSRESSAPPQFVFALVDLAVSPPCFVRFLQSALPNFLLARRLG